MQGKTGKARQLCRQGKAREGRQVDRLPWPRKQKKNTGKRHHRRTGAREGDGRDTAVSGGNLRQAAAEGVARDDDAAVAHATQIVDHGVLP